MIVENRKQKVYNTMNKKAFNVCIPPEVVSLFEERPLLSGERARDYDAMRDGLISSMRPQSYLEWLSFKHILDASWDIRRLTKLKTAIPNMSWNEALRRLIESTLPGDEDERQLAAQKEVDAWYTISHAQEKIMAQLQRRGLYEDTISALAMNLRLPEIELVDRQLERARRNLAAMLREYSYYQAAGTWEFPKALTQVIGADAALIELAPSEDQLADAK